jgi:hypothetical protein
MRPSAVFAVLLFTVASGCTTLGDPIPSYPNRAQGPKAQDEDRCERTAIGADLITRRLNYISCMIAKGWRVYVPVRSKSGGGIANLTVVETRDQPQNQVFADLSSCGEKLDVVVGGSTMSAATGSTSPFGVIVAGGVAAFAARLVDPFAACLAERGYRAARWDGS